MSADGGSLRRMVTPKVSVGVGTLVGYGLTLVGGAATAWATAEGAGSQLSPGLLAALTFAAGILTTLGRQYQGKPVEAGTEETAVSGLQALAAEAQANVVKAQAAPDGADGPQVPFSGAPPQAA